MHVFEQDFEKERPKSKWKSNSFTPKKTLQNWLSLSCFPSASWKYFVWENKEDVFQK